MAIKNIKADKLKDLLKTDKYILIDVREPDEHKAAAIPGSKNIPLGTISPDTLKEFDGKKIIFHCKSGGRSSKACEKAASFLDEEIMNLQGGIEEWQKTGSDVKCTGCKLPIMQQVQLIAGSLVLTGVVLSMVTSPSWIYLSGFVGLGLIFAGVTGWCGMAKILSKMPWNK